MRNKVAGRFLSAAMPIFNSVIKIIIKQLQLETVCASTPRTTCRLGNNHYWIMACQWLQLKQIDYYVERVSASKIRPHVNGIYSAFTVTCLWQLINTNCSSITRHCCDQPPAHTATAAAWQKEDNSKDKCSKSQAVLQ